LATGSKKFRARHNSNINNKNKQRGSKLEQTTDQQAEFVDVFLFSRKLMRSACFGAWTPPNINNGQ
jgi:phage replication-related protein YjqB (UPF0714/DUF867 family)